ncbi:hypothetical protein CBS147346_8194 [Aspergillus niger]|nr:hypothetical protein CBS147346_8194 [Aspergillus niger]
MASFNPTLKTPEYCTADFSLIPIGSQSASFSKQVADIQRLMQNSGLKYQMHATGTIVGMLPFIFNPFRCWIGIFVVDIGPNSA